MVKAQKTFRHDKSSIHNHHQEDFAAFNEADSSDTQYAKIGKIWYYTVFVLGHQILDLHGFPRTTQILEKIAT